MTRRAALESLAFGLEHALAGVRELLTAPDPDEWIDQDRSPLGRRSHCELARAGHLGGARKVAGKWLVRRRDLDAYIERQGAGAAAPAEASILSFRAPRRQRRAK